MDINDMDIARKIAPTYRLDEIDLHGCGGASLTERPAPSIFGPNIAFPSSQHWMAISWQSCKMRIHAPLAYEATFTRLEAA